ncbi:MAG: hypothetical protein AAFQ40_14095 [Cyanobacteria bacterium J06623_5]
MHRKTTHFPPGNRPFTHQTARTNTIQTFERLCLQLSRRTLKRDLKQLVSQGLIKTAGGTN